MLGYNVFPHWRTVIDQLFNPAHSMEKKRDILMMILYSRLDFNSKGEIKISFIKRNFNSKGAIKISFIKRFSCIFSFRKINRVWRSGVWFTFQMFSRRLLQISYKSLNNRKPQRWVTSKTCMAVGASNSEF